MNALGGQATQTITYCSEDVLTRELCFPKLPTEDPCKETVGADKTREWTL